MSGHSKTGGRKGPLERFHSLLHHSSHSVFVVELPSGRLVEANENACCCLGCAPDQILSKSLRDLIPSSVWDGICDLLTAKKSLGEPRGPEVIRTVLIGEDDVEVPVEMSLSLDTRGEERYGVAVVRDLSDREHLEELLRESQRVLSTLMSSLPGMAYRCHEADHGAMELASEGCFELTGYAPAELAGAPDLSYAGLIHPDDREAVAEAIRSAVAARSPFQVEYRILSASGEEKWITDRGHGIFSVFSQDGELLAIEGFAADVTERKKAEELLKNYSRTLEAEVSERTRELNEKNVVLEETLDQLRTTQDQLIMQQKMASLGALTAGIAHEIKNPLNFVNNFASLSTDLVKEFDDLFKRQQGHIDPEAYEAMAELMDDVALNVERIGDHGRRADSIVRGMLLHSRGKPGDRQMTDLNALLDEDAKLAFHGLRARDAAFDVQIETDLDPDLAEIEVVPQEIGRVFLNMMDNACQAALEKKETAPPGFVPTVSVGTRDLGDAVEIRIRDNGIGIPKEAMNDIFTPFFTTKRSGRGTGLGLSVCYDIIVQEHKGIIEVDSQEGEFTQFLIRLPRNSGKP